MARAGGQVRRPGRGLRTPSDDDDDDDDGGGGSGGHVNIDDKPTIMIENDEYDDDNSDIHCN